MTQRKTLTYKTMANTERYKNADSAILRKVYWDFKEAQIIKKRRHIEDLKDVYVKINLRKQGFTPEAITPELIEVKRILIKTKRLCKTLNN